MTSRSDLAFVAISLVSLGATYSWQLVQPESGLPPIALFPIFAYVSYWAFKIRATLSEEAVRNQALGVGLVSLGVYTLLLQLAFSTNYAPIIPGVVTFIWVDSSVLAARRSDPLWRDTFHWSKVRVPAWAVMILGVVAFAVQLAFPQNGLLAQVGGLFVLYDVVGPYLIAVAILPVVARRSRDASIRRHLVWFAGYGVFFVLLWVNLLLGLIVLNGAVLYLDISQVLIIVVAAYCLYMSAKSLVHLGAVRKDS
jgi:hypothetical protein